MKTIINLTPHDVVIFDDNGNEIRRYPVSGTIARAEQMIEELEYVDGIRYIKTYFGNPINLPDKKEDTLYIVSVITAEAAYRSGRGAEDLLISALPLRDENGFIKGCQAFAKYIP